MVSETQALAILAEARKYFKGGSKSTNKYYFAQDLQHFDRSTPKKEKRAETVRDKQQELVTQRKRVENWSPSDVGSDMVSTSNKLGNCYEMSCVASYLAQQKGIKNWLVEVEYPGDHVMCVLSDRRPTWKNIEEMSKDTSEALWIVDVWANVCATPSRFEKKLREKFSKWAKENKAIGWDKGSGSVEKVRASDKMMLNALTKNPLKYKRAITDCSSCGKKGAKNLCTKCHDAIYCDSACQKKHWPTHKGACKSSL